MAAAAAAAALASSPSSSTSSPHHHHHGHHMGLPPPPHLNGLTGYIIGQNGMSTGTSTPNSTTNGNSNSSLNSPNGNGLHLPHELYANGMYDGEFSFPLLFIENFLVVTRLAWTNACCVCTNVVVLVVDVVKGPY